MYRQLGRGVGILLTVAGVIFTLQGIGILKGSFMSNTTTWTVAGPIIAAVGAAIAYAARGRGR